MVKILGISGKKQSGKNTAANLITGKVLLSRGMVDDFYINKGGELVVSTKDNNNRSGYGVFDSTRVDQDFVSYAERELWPYVKLYSFADGLKRLCIEFFGLKSEQVFGTDDQKNEKIPHLLWENMPEAELLPFYAEGEMTAREFMQFFGTNVMRRMYEPVHINHALNRIKRENSKLAIVPDVRFANEVEAIKNAGGKVIRLERSVFKDEHSSETALDKDKFDWSNFDFIIDNSNNSTEDFCSQVDSMVDKLELIC